MRTNADKHSVKRLVARFCADESGATAIEYGLVAGIMGVAAVGFKGVFDALKTEFLDPTKTAVSGI